MFQKVFDGPKPAGRSAGRSGRFTIDVFALISRLVYSLIKPAGQMLSL
jgi:hypothetical protein